MSRPKRMADCHPERPHAALGMCRACYGLHSQEQARRRRGAPIRTKHTYPFNCPLCGKTVTSHAVHGMCSACWDVTKPAAPCTSCGSTEPGQRMRGMCLPHYNNWYYRHHTLPKRLAARQGRGQQQFTYEQEDAL